MQKSLIISVESNTDWNVEPDTSTIVDAVESDNNEYIYTTVKDSGVLLTIRYLCEPRQRRGSAEKIWEDILQEFAEKENIDFAYPTQRFYKLYEDRKTDIHSIDDDPFDSTINIQ